MSTTLHRYLWSRCESHWIKGKTRKKNCCHKYERQQKGKDIFVRDVGDEEKRYNGQKEWTGEDREEAGTIPLFSTKSKLHFLHHSSFRLTHLLFSFLIILSITHFYVLLSCFPLLRSPCLSTCVVVDSKCKYAQGL